MTHALHTRGTKSLHLSLSLTLSFCLSPGHGGCSMDLFKTSNHYCAKQHVCHAKWLAAQGTGVPGPRLLHKRSTQAFGCMRQQVLAQNGVKHQLELGWPAQFQLNLTSALRLLARCFANGITRAFRRLLTCVIVCVAGEDINTYALRQAPCECSCSCARVSPARGHITSFKWA